MPGQAEKAGQVLRGGQARRGGQAGRDGQAGRGGASAAARGPLARILRYPQRAILNAGMTLAAIALERRIRKALRRDAGSGTDPGPGG